MKDEVKTDVAVIGGGYTGLSANLHLAQADTDVLVLEAEHIGLGGTAMVNGGIHNFVKAVSMELKNCIRINVVSSGLVEDAVEKYQEYFPGHNPIPKTKVVNGYVKSVLGAQTGKSSECMIIVDDRLFEKTSVLLT